MGWVLDEVKRSKQNHAVVHTLTHSSLLLAVAVGCLALQVLDGQEEFWAA